MTERVTFASDEWIALLESVAKEHADLLDAIQTMEGPLTIVIRPERKRLPDGLVVWIDAGLGRVNAIRKLRTEDEQPTKFVLTADYAVWGTIAQGKQGLIRAILFGRIRVKGDKVLLVRQVRTASVLGKMLSEMPTHYP